MLEFVRCLIDSASAQGPDREDRVRFCQRTLFFIRIEVVAEKMAKEFIHRLEIGFPVKVEHPNYERDATVTDIAESSLAVQLSAAKAGLSFKAGEKVRLKYWDPQGIYFCHAEVSRVYGPGNLKVDLSIVSRPVAMQRRRTSRLRSKISFSFEVIEAVHRGLTMGTVFQADTLDLSGNGLSFETTTHLKAMDLLKLELQLSESEQVSTLATVVKSEKVKRGENYVNSVGLEFSELLPETRKQIVEFVDQAQASGDHAKT